MIVSVLIFLGTLALMGAAAWHANETLPSGQLPLGRTNKPNANRIVVVLQAPSVYLTVLLIFLIKGVIERDATMFGTQANVALFSVSIVLLVAQQAQFWGIRRIMRRGRL